VSPRRRQDFEHSFKRIRKTDPRRELEEERDWRRDVEEELSEDSPIERDNTQEEH